MTSPVSPCAPCRAPAERGLRSCVAEVSWRPTLYLQPGREASLSSAQWVIQVQHLVLQACRAMSGTNSFRSVSRSRARSRNSRQVIKDVPRRSLRAAGGAVEAVRRGRGFTPNAAQPDPWEPGSINGIGGSVPSRDTEQGVWALNPLGTGHSHCRGWGV